MISPLGKGIITFQFFKQTQNLLAFSSLSKRPRNVERYRVPILYGFRPWIRGRLSLRGLALRRNPWTFGLDVSDIDLCYSCQHYHFWYLQPRSRKIFIDLQNVPLPSSLRLTEGFVPSVNSLSPLHFRCEKAWICCLQIEDCCSQLFLHDKIVWLRISYGKKQGNCLDLWAFTLSLKGGWFQAHLQVVLTFSPPLTTKLLFRDLRIRSGLFPSRHWTLSPNVCLWHGFLYCVRYALGQTVFGV